MGLLRPGRIKAALQWRMDVMYERLPPRARAALNNARSNARILRGRTSYDRSRLMRTFRESLALLQARAPGAPIGDYLEFGVYHGTSLSCMHRVREELGLDDSMRLFGFDSFEGLPESAAWEDDGEWAPGEFASSLALTRRNLRRWGVPDADVTLVKGWYEDTLTRATRASYAIRQASVVMIDCDLYSSTRSALAFAAPLIRTHAVFVFDDWDSGGLGSKQMGEARAFAELLAASPDLSAEEISGLNYKKKAGPRVFLVTRGRARAD